MAPARGYGRPPDVRAGAFLTTTLDRYGDSALVDNQGIKSLGTKRVRDALKNLVLRRAAYLADNAKNIIYPHFARLF